MSLYLRATGTVVALAAIAFLAYLHFHHSAPVMNTGLQPVTVLVAKVPIPKGTVGNWIANRPLYTVVTLRPSQVMKGALTDPSSLRGEVATQDIFRGSQLT